MNPWTVTIGSAAALSFGNYLYRKFKLNPKLDIEFTKEIRHGLKICNEVLRIVSSSGGMSSHPWHTEMGIYKEDEVQEYLSRFHDRIKDKKHQDKIKELKLSFRKLFANSVVNPRIAIYEDIYSDDLTPLDREQNLAKSLRQKEILDKARPLVQEIEKYVAQLEKNAVSR